MIEREQIPSPAQTYDLNIVASVLGRYATPNLDRASQNELGEILLETIDTIRDGQMPEVPHTAPELLGEAIAFDQKLLMQLDEGPASEIMDPKQQDTLRGLLVNHVAICEAMLEGKAGLEMLTRPEDIAAAYELHDMWTNPETVISEEFEKWKTFKDHPFVPSDLQQTISLDETKRLLELMWRRVIEEVDMPDVNVHLMDDPQHYHVFWAALANGLDYATPRDYDRATQLSFDLPHNATHLAHLTAIGQTGSSRYDDNMARRAYFEAATVFSEHRTVQVALRDDEFGQELADIFDGAMSAEELAGWVVADRGYEFKLRAARYMADIAMVQGVSFDEAVQGISKTLDIPLGDARKESIKYLPWTGLGAAYTFGYRRLIEKGVTSVQQVLRAPDGTAITSWNQQDSVD